MAAAATAGYGFHPFSAPDATPYEAHILSLLGTISQPPSPSYPFPSNQLPVKTPLTLYGGDKTSAQAVIEAAIVELGDRLWLAERKNGTANGGSFQGQQAALPTPEWSPPVNDDAMSGSLHKGQITGPTCPTCSRPVHPPTQDASAANFSSLPLATSLSTPTGPTSGIPNAKLNPNARNILTTSNGASVLTGGPGAAGWNRRPGVGETGMTAEKELELLKAQVQDIARVCKVSPVIDVSVTWS